MALYKNDDDDDDYYKDISIYNYKQLEYDFRVGDAQAEAASTFYGYP